jgi:CRP/FNR family transcriptional regulator
MVKADTAPMENVRIDSLRNIELFSSLTDEELRQISGKVVLQEFAKNETILREEDTSNFMYIILLGKVKVVQTTEDGKEIILAMHEAQEFFGEISLLDGKTSPATVVALEESFIGFISRDNFFSLLGGQGKVLEKLLLILCSRLRESWQRIHMLNFNDAAHRVKMLLLTLSCDKGKKTPEGILLNMKLTHQEIADMAGLTRETVTRAIDKWRKGGEITVMENKFIRLNVKFLGKDISLAP